jgi:hypothetical protein
VLKSSAEWRQLLPCLRSEWLPAQQGMGLRLSGTLPAITGTWELRVLYHSPLAMSSGVLDKDTLTIGGQWRALPHSRPARHRTPQHSG